MDPKRSGTQFKSSTAPYTKLDEFYSIVLSHESIDLICYSDATSPQGMVGVYMKCSKTERGFGGGVITIDMFDELQRWIQSDTRVKSRGITFRGHINRGVRKSS